MTNFLTPAQARETLKCPIAKTFAEKIGPWCDAEKCAIWRTLPAQADDPAFQSAIKREMACLAQDNGKGRPAVSFHKQAVANVMKNPDAYGCKWDNRGWCGLGGKPET